MAVSDDQFELLETYADGELPAADEDALRRRLEADPQLAAALESLRAEHDLRMAAWTSLEPSQASVDRLVLRVEAALDRQAVWADRLRRYRIPFAAAACILIGFSVGWLIRGSAPQMKPVNGAMEQVAEAPHATGVVPGAPANPNLVTVGNERGPVDLPVVDEYGRQVGTQHFNSAKEAADFLDGLSRWQQTKEQIKSGDITLTGSEKSERF